MLRPWGRRAKALIAWGLYAPCGEWHAFVLQGYHVFRMTSVTGVVGRHLFGSSYSRYRVAARLHAICRRMCAARGRGCNPRNPPTQLHMRCMTHDTIYPGASLAPRQSCDFTQCFIANPHHRLTAAECAQVEFPENRSVACQPQRICKTCQLHRTTECRAPNLSMMSLVCIPKCC